MDATSNRVCEQCGAEVGVEPVSLSDQRLLCRHCLAAYLATLKADAIPNSAADVPQDWLKQSVEATPGSFAALQDADATRNRVTEHPYYPMQDQMEAYDRGWRDGADWHARGPGDV